MDRLWTIAPFAAIALFALPWLTEKKVTCGDGQTLKSLHEMLDNTEGMKQLRYNVASIYGGKVDYSLEFVTTKKSDSKKAECEAGILVQGLRTTNSFINYTKEATDNGGFILTIHP